MKIVIFSYFFDQNGLLKTVEQTLSVFLSAIMVPNIQRTFPESLSNIALRFSTFYLEKQGVYLKYHVLGGEKYFREIDLEIQQNELRCSNFARKRVLQCLNVWYHQ